MRTIRFRFVVAMAVLVASGVATYWMGNVALRCTRQVALRSDGIDRLNDLLSSLKDAETGERGFVLTGNPEYLQPYNTAIANFNESFNAVRPQNDSGITPDGIAKLKRLCDEKLAVLETIIDLRRKQGFDAAVAVVDSGVSKRYMDDIRLQIAEMVQREKAAVQELQHTADRMTTYRTTTFVLATALNICFLIYVFRSIRNLFMMKDRVETELRKQKQLIAVTLASIGDGVIVTDAEGRITFLNDVTTTLTGWTVAEAVGKPCVQVFNIINESSRQPVENPVSKVLSLGVTAGLANHTILIHRDGTERHIDDSAAPIRDDKGNLLGVVLVYHDITERRRLERENAERLVASRLLSSVVDSSDDAIINKSSEGIVQSWNAAAERLFGFTAEQAIGRNISFIIPEDHVQEEQQLFAHVLSGQHVHHIDTIRRRNDGHAVDVSLALSPIQDEAGRVVGVSTIARDITDRKKSEKRTYDLMCEVQEGDRRKDEFLATLAHELRNPLAPIRNCLQLMRVSDDSREAVEQTRTIMERQVDQMIRLVDDLLDVSRINQGKLELRKERVELATVVNNAVETSRPLIESSGNELTISLPSLPVFMDADVTRLGQVVGNLLNNAAKYSERGGCIALTAERQGSDVVLSIKDTGIGIPPHMLSKIFDMFTQVDRSLEKSQGGLGIGLTLVKRLVEMHGGSVEARSEGNGKGSEFVIRLPLLIESSKVKMRMPTARPTMTALRILVVDDNRDSAATLAKLLKITGNDTVTAHDGLEAVEAAERLRPDVVLLDIGLPKLNGYDVARRIREQPWGKDMVLIALTGWGQDEDRLKSIEAGFDEHLVKPVDFTALTSLLAETHSRSV